MNKILLPALLLLGTASAAPRVSAQSIIVNPTQPDLQVRVWTDRDTSGQGTPNYFVGDRIRLYTSVNEDAYVYLFNVNPDGSIDQILPNRYASGANFVKANTVKQFPGAGDRFTFDISGPYGVNKVLALASKTPLDLNQVSSFKSGQPFAQVNVSGQEKFAQALSIVVNPIPDDNWVTDTAYYNVAGGASVVTPQPQPPVSVTPAPAPARPNPIISIGIDITIRPFSGAQNVRTYNTDGGSRIEFTANSRLETVFNSYNDQLVSQGYTLRSRENRGDRIEARYTKGRQNAKLEVKQNASGRFEVEITK